MAETDMTPRKSGAAKKWIIGCSGCLVLVIIGLVVVLLAGRSVFDSLMQTSNNTVQEILGKSYEVPPGVTAIGIPAGQGPVSKMVMLMDMKGGAISFVLNASMSEEELAQLKAGDKAKAEEIIKRFGMLLHSRSSSSRLDMSDLRFDETKMAALPNGKKFPLSLAVAKSEASKGAAYSPIAIGLVPEAAGEMVMVLMMDAQHSGSGPDADRSASEAMLEAKMMALVSGSELANRLQN